jgi:hypothetical protein
MMSFEDYKKFLAENPTMHKECEDLRDMIVNFTNKYRIVLENRELGEWACDEQAMLEVFYDNRVKLCIARQVPEYWDEED